MEAASLAMNQQQAFHLLRSAVVITGCREWVVLGSQALALWDVERTPVLEASEELDIYTPQSEELTDLVEGTLGEGSMFQDTFGYFAHGVGQDTATFPPTWKTRTRTRTIPGTDGATVTVPHPTDIAVAKLIAFRPKDTAFVRELLRCGFTSYEQLRTATTEVEGEDERKMRALRWVESQR